MTADEQTLTMDETTPESGQLSEEEMDSLQVGEQMQEAQDTRLAGKYNNAKELEKAYIELEKKIGEKNTVDDPAKDPTTDEAPETPVENASILEKLWNERDQGFSDESLKELTKTNPGELAKAYMELRAKGPKPTPLSQADSTALKNVVGGNQNYNQMVAWAESNLDADEVAMYDSVIDSGNPTACYFAIKALQARYRDTVGQDGTLVQGKPPSSSGNQFRSQAELVKAMSDSRYDNDPAYRQDVIDKLERSKVNF